MTPFPMRTRADLIQVIRRFMDDAMTDEDRKRVREVFARMVDSSHGHVVAAAIWVDIDTPMINGPHNLDTGVFIAGHSHAQCFPAAHAVTEDKTKFHQGFLLSDNTWATRKAALAQAMFHGQVLIEYTSAPQHGLFSEDINYPPEMTDG